MLSDSAQELVDRLSEMFDRAEAMRILGRNIRPRSVAGRQIRGQAVFAFESWGERPVQHALLDGLVRVGTSAEHGRAFVHLLGLADPAPFAVFASTRALVETSARAYWHLSAGSAARRVGRYLGELRASHQHFSRATKVLGHEQRLYADLDAWDSEAAARGIVVETPPKYYDAVVSAYARTRMPLHGPALYRVMSGVAHAEMWGVWALLQNIPADETSPVWEDVHFPLQDQHVALLARHVLVIHRLLIQEYMKVFGREALLVASWKQSLNASEAALRPMLSAGRPR